MYLTTNMYILKHFDIIRDNTNRENFVYIGLRFMFVYQKSLQCTLQTVFLIQNHLCVLVLWIQKDYFVVKRLVWNVRIKAFWYTVFDILDSILIFTHIFLSIWEISKTFIVFLRTSGEYLRIRFLEMNGFASLPPA